MQSFSCFSQNQAVICPWRDVPSFSWSSGTRNANAEIARALRRSPGGPSIEWDKWDKWDSDKWNGLHCNDCNDWPPTLRSYFVSIRLASTAVQVAEGDLGILAGSLGAHPKDSWCHADAKVFFKMFRTSWILWYYYDLWRTLGPFLLEPWCGRCDGHSTNLRLPLELELNVCCELMVMSHELWVIYFLFWVNDIFNILCLKLKFILAHQ